MDGLKEMVRGNGLKIIITGNHGVLPQIQTRLKILRCFSLQGRHAIDSEWGRNKDNSITSMLVMGACDCEG